MICRSMAMSAPVLVRASDVATSTIPSMKRSDDEAVRAEVRRAFDEYVPNGWFVPAIPNGAPLTPGINEIVIDEMNRYGEHFFERMGK